MKICVLIPVYNEGKTIAQVVKAIKLKGLDVFVVDDGSNDHSGDFALASGAVLLTNTAKMGKGGSLKKGFDYILKLPYDGIIMMDGDAQHDTEDLDKFINLAKANPVSVITGNRMDNPKGMPLVRYLTNKFMSLLISLACRQRIPDTQCGYRYVSCEILKHMKLISGEFEIETEILMKSSKKGYKIYSVPIKTIYQDEVSHINPFKDTIRFFVYFFKELFSFKKD